MIYTIVPTSSLTRQKNNRTHVEWSGLLYDRLVRRLINREYTVLLSCPQYSRHDMSERCVLLCVWFCVCCVLCCVCVVCTPVRVMADPTGPQYNLSTLLYIEALNSHNLSTYAHFSTLIKTLCCIIIMCPPLLFITTHILTLLVLCFHTGHSWSVCENLLNTAIQIFEYPVS